MAELPAGATSWRASANHGCGCLLSHPIPCMAILKTPPHGKQHKHPTTRSPSPRSGILSQRALVSWQEEAGPGQNTAPGAVSASSHNPSQP